MRYGVDLQLSAMLQQAAEAPGAAIHVVSSHELFLSAEEIESYRKPYVGEDPSFGWVNDDGVLEDILHPDRLEAVVQECRSTRQGP